MIELPDKVGVGMVEGDYNMLGFTSWTSCPNESNLHQNAPEPSFLLAFDTSICKRKIDGTLTSGLPTCNMLPLN